MERLIQDLNLLDQICKQHPMPHSYFDSESHLTGGFVTDLEHYVVRKVRGYVNH